MTNSKKILITTATHEIFIVRGSHEPKVAREYCDECMDEIEMYELYLSPGICRLRMREIIHQIETGAIHSIESANGRLLVCNSSLQNFFK